ncbi:uncharacterized protein LOC141816644 [Curcuma longa]|uniref:uncharacterized protein LOC141816644 n=1 Tax=Curcuma longa TaxID=136217 RepID=UPI003D9E37F3
MEEAKKAMELAEIKFKANDVEGAKRIAKNACDMFGDLPGIRHAVAAYEVHLAAAMNNWHAVLGLLPGDDDDMRKACQQFLKMSILTHPDKNPSAAADGAFKFVMEAWNRLSKAAHCKSTSSNSNAKDDDNNSNAESGCKKQRQKEEANKGSNSPRYHVCPHCVDGRCKFCFLIWYSRRISLTEREMIFDMSFGTD